MPSAVSDSVAEGLERAGVRMCARGDRPGAVATMLRAAQLSADEAGRTRRLAGAAYLGAYLRSDLDRTRELLAEVRALQPDPTASLEVAAAAASVLIMADGELETAYRLLVQAIDATAGQTPSELACFAVAGALLQLCRLSQRADWWEAREQLLERLGGSAATQVSLATVMEDGPPGIPTDVLDELDRAIVVIASSTSPAEILMIADAAAQADRLRGCRASLRRVVASDLSGDATLLLFAAHSLLGVDDFHTGHWASADEQVDRAVAVARGHGYGLAEYGARTVQSLTAALRGDWDRARGLADEMLAWSLPRAVGHQVDNARYCLLLVALGEGDFEAAYRHASQITPAGSFPAHQPRSTWVMLDLVEAAVRTGRGSAARAHVECIKRSGVTHISARMAMLAAGAEALIAGDREAIALFEAGLAVPGASSWPFDQARVQLLLGERLRRSREPARSRSPLIEALETFRRLGAEPWAARVAKELRATGGSRARAAHAVPDGLTPQELEIAQLAASGLSNKEIGQRLYLSHRTVGAHLYRIFPKLEITSRASLRDALEAMPAADELMSAIAG